jgi:hypothetical protein
MVLAFLVSCGSDRGLNIPVTGVVLDKNATILQIGQTEKLTATVQPNNATDQTVIWTSSDSNIVSVNDGQITAHVYGIVDITVTTNDGNHSAICRVEVSPTLSISPERTKLRVGETRTITAQVNVTGSGYRIVWEVIRNNNELRNDTLTIGSDTFLAVFTVPSYAVPGDVFSITASLYNGNDLAAPCTPSVEITVEGETQSGWITRNAPSGNWVSVAYGNGVFVAVGSDGKIMRSTDGIAWSIATSLSAYFTGIDYGGGRFVAVGTGGCSTNIVSSSDGITWTSNTTRLANSFNNVAYGNGVFVAATSLTQNNREFAVSSNGTNWTFVNPPAPNVSVAYANVSFGDGRFIVNRYDTSTLLVSTNGTSWTYNTTRTPSNLRYVNRITFGNGIFVGTGQSSQTGYTSLASSTNGVDWTIHTTLVPYGSVAYGNGLFVMVPANSASRGNSWESSNGTDWNIGPSMDPGDLQSVCYGNGMFVAVGPGGVRTLNR